jgi:hypothetical protein
LGCGALHASTAQADALLINHHSTDISRVPKEYIAKAQKNWRIAYGHTSHGSQIVAGMDALRLNAPDQFGFGRDAASGLSLWDKMPRGDLGNPDRTSWADRTRELLNGIGRDRNLVMWSWCGQVSSASEADIATYLQLMSQLEVEYPAVRFVYMTGHLDGTGANGNLNRRNEQIREYCRANRKILFDFADIESYAPGGNVNFMELGANDGCYYRSNGARRNWADDWLSDNPDHTIALPNSAAHSRPLNAALKGRAFWWMLARLSGWKG